MKLRTRFKQEMFEQQRSIQLDRVSGIYSVSFSEEGYYVL